MSDSELLRAVGDLTALIPGVPPMGQTCARILAPHLPESRKDS